MKTAEILESVSVDEEWLGKKGGLGFYEHHGKEKIPNPRLDSLLDTLRTKLDISPKLFSDQTIVDRCILSMVNEAAKCMEENIVANPAYLDMAMIMGSGFPPFRGGLLKYADQFGIAEVVSRLENLEAEFGFRFAPAEILKSMSKANSTFY